MSAASRELPARTDGALRPALMRWTRAAGGDPEHVRASEWLETNELGDSASSSLAFCPTRRYHGLLVARPPGSPKRHVFLARFDEHALAEGQRTALAQARYGSVLAAPDPPLEAFELAPWPRSTYRLKAGFELVRELLIVREAHAVLCRWTLSRAQAPLELELRPLLACREADHLTVANEALDARTENVAGGLRWQPYAALPALCCRFEGPGARFEAEPLWYRGLSYAADEARGYAGREDQFSPGVLRALLEPGQSLTVLVALEPCAGAPAALWESESRARAERAAGVEPRDLAGRARLAATDFLERTPSGRVSITAGYPWFDEWGRDTFIALPGLLLARGELARAAELLSGAVPFLRGGLLPNIFGLAPADSHYGSADAALWFARAVDLFQRAGGYRDAYERTLRPALGSIAEAYLAGSELGLHVDRRGLLHAGTPELNPTWMDARTSQGPVTPRDGAPVELNALWYALLAQLAAGAAERGARAEAERWSAEQRRARAAFRAHFWLGDQLADGWKDGRADASVRPNMVIAAALRASPLARPERGAVVECARRHLLTPRGLRTLAPSDPRYCGSYAGGPEQRDRAYHQGTAWPWLLGFYVEAHLRAFGDGAAERAALRALWLDFLPELERAGLGHISEVFDGDAPQRPGGTIAQAWNTGELLRSLALLEGGLE